MRACRSLHPKVHLQRFNDVCLAAAGPQPHAQEYAHAFNGNITHAACFAGVVSCYIMERFAPGINFLLSAELDHAHKNYKFGFGFTAGE